MREFDRYAMAQYRNQSVFDRLEQSRQAKYNNVRRIAKGREETFAWRTMPKMAAYPDYFDDTQATTTLTTTTNFIRIHNASSTAVTTANVTTGSNSGYLTVWYGDDQGTDAYDQYDIPDRPPPKRYDPRILNRYLSASDLLEEFIKDLAELGVRQGEVLDVPIELFINWLIVKAAEADGHEPPSDVKLLPEKVTPIRKDRCRCCGRFITKARRAADVLFCNGQHMDRFMEKVA